MSLLACGLEASSYIMASISDEIDLFIAQSLLGGESLFNLESIIISNGNLLWNDKKQLEIIILNGNDSSKLSFWKEMRSEMIKFGIKLSFQSVLPFEMIFRLNLELF